MKIAIAGGTGFLGRPLGERLTAQGHQVVNLPRGTADVDGMDAVINLAGESIAAKRWTKAQKQRIVDSRVLTTRALADAIARAAAPPSVFISGSAVGYYGPRGDEIATEYAPAGSDFLASACVAWEAEADRAIARTRVVRVRTGLVLHLDGGALPQILMPFWLGVGGPMGSGRRSAPWIHRTDWIDLVCWALRTPSVGGAVNATAPNPVTNKEFARAVGRAFHRPAFMTTPGFVLRLMLGEMADGLLLSGQRAVPAKADALGFSFTYSHVDDALAAIFKTR